MSGATNSFLKKFGGGYTASSCPTGAVLFDPRLHDAIPTEDQLPTIPDWVTGHISLTDARFLHNLILSDRPTRMLEVGVASGYSTSVILQAMGRIASEGAFPSDIWLHSFDLLSHCYFAPERPAGSVVDEIIPHRRNQVHFHFGETAHSARSVGDSFSMAFLDGNHQHPWPLFDLMAIWPTMACDSWVVLHDVFLPVLEQDCQSTGPNLLFTLWPGVKLLQPPNHETRNVAAIRLPKMSQAILSSLAVLLQLEWECEGPSEEMQEKIMAPFLT